MMKYDVDDWHFRPTESNVVAAELYLDNGQKAILEVLPLSYTQTGASAGNEIIVWCELPGEKADEGTCAARWVSRPPDKQCPWSRVELPPVLIEQINERLVADPQTVH